MSKKKKDLEGLVKEYEDLNRKNASDHDIAIDKGNQQYYKGRAEVYKAVASDLRELISSGDEIVINHAAEKQAKFWKGFAVGGVVWGLTLATLFYWIINLLHML